MDVDWQVVVVGGEDCGDLLWSYCVQGVEVQVQGVVCCVQWCVQMLEQFQVGFVVIDEVLLVLVGWLVVEVCVVVKYGQQGQVDICGVGGVGDVQGKFGGVGVGVVVEVVMDVVEFCYCGVVGFEYFDVELVGDDFDLFW